jgi:RND family efflux transporter MFP subunit
VKEGQRVSAGTLLARLNTDITQSSIEEVETNLELAAVMFKKQKELWDQNIGSEVQYLQAKSSVESLEARLKTMQAQLAMASIRAPFSGIVDQIFRKEGELAVPGVQFMRLVNLSEVIVSADIAETYINDVKAGDMVSVEFPSYGDDKTDVKVSRTGNVISTNNRSFPIEIRMKNAGRNLKPNSMAVVHINDYSNEEAMSVPSIIIKQDVNKGFFLFIVDTDDKGNTIASKRYVKPGKSYGGYTEILSGLEAGDMVIVEGYNTVANGTRIDIL